MIRFIILALFALLTAWLLPGVEIESFWIGLLVVLVLGIINITVKPLILLLTLPITIITLGLFAIVISTTYIMLSDYIIDGFTIVNIWWALLFSLIYGFLKALITKSK